MKNNIISKMKKGEKTLGTFHELGSASAIECLGYAGLDYVVIDTEHGPFEPESVLTYIRAAKLSNIDPFVRVPDSSRKSILKSLDVGAKGLIIPNIKTVEEVKRVVQYGKYFPLGERGVAPTAGSNFWQTKISENGLENYFKTSNEETMIIPQCETLGCLKNIQEIVNLDGVDGIFVGPYDLSTAMKKPGQFDNPKVIEAITHILNVCKKASKFCFIYAGTIEDIGQRFTEGFDSVTYSMDALIFIDAIRSVKDRILK